MFLGKYGDFLGLIPRCLHVFTIVKMGVPVKKGSHHVVGIGSSPIKDVWDWAHRVSSFVQILGSRKENQSSLLTNFLLITIVR